MKLPFSYKAVSLSGSAINGTYPPLGFYPFAEHQLGNGDTFGLYWPIGHEDSEPIVAETYHDEWSIQPHFSTLDRFLEASARSEEADEDEQFIGTPTVFEDPQSPAACLKAAREHLKSQNVTSAIALLESSVSVLPEYTEAQALLCTQYRRVGQPEAALRSAIQSIISPSCFGTSSVQILKWLSAQSNVPSEIARDPVWLNRGGLSMKFGGVKENDEYLLMRTIIDEYLSNGAFIPALTLMQKYAELMSAETVSFQERYQFDRKRFVAWQHDIAINQYGKSRVLDLTAGNT